MVPANMLIPVYCADQMLHLSDGNFIWFAEIFKEMLLFHGTNLPKGRGGGQSSDDVLRQQKQYRDLEDRLGPGGRAQGASAGSRRSVMGGPGPPGAQGGQHKIASFFSSLRDPSSCFPGYQQFFFRYLLVMDSARLNNHLSDTLLQEIFILTSDADANGPYSELVSDISRQGWSACVRPGGVRADSPPELKRQSSPIAQGGARSPASPTSGRYVTFISRILKLKVLGRFLGLLHFYPSWNISVGAAASLESPLMTLLITAASLRSKINPSMCLPLSQIVSAAWKEGSLMLTVPWVIGYLRMLAWDRTSMLNASTAMALSECEGHGTVPKEHIAVASVLWTVIHSPTFSLRPPCTMSHNRYD